MNNRFLTLLALAQLLILLVSCEVPSEIDKKTIANQNPAGSITFPVNGSIVNPGAPITIKAQAIDSDGQIAKVEFYLDVITNKIGEDTTAPYEFTYTAGVDGSLPEHKLYVAVTDVDGGYHANLTPTTIKVNNVPTCTITSPSTNAYYAADSVRAVDVIVNAFDSDATDRIDSVVFKIDNSRIYAAYDSIAFNTYGVSIPGNLFNSGKSNLIEAIAYDTHGGKTTSFINLNMISSSKIAFYDGFEGYSNFNISMNLKPIWAPSEIYWAQKDLDQTATWMYGTTSYTNNGYTGAYMIFNTAFLTNDTLNLAHDGKKMAACFNSMTVVNNDWIISKKVSNIKTSTKLSFWARDIDAEYAPEQFAVYISKTGTNVGNGEETQDGTTIKVGDFTKVSTGALKVYTTAPAKWTNYTFDLSGYANQEIYIAIACRTFNGFAFMVDDFMVFDANYSNSKSDVPVNHAFGKCKTPNIKKLQSKNRIKRIK